MSINKKSAIAGIFALVISGIGLAGPAAASPIPTPFAIGSVSQGIGLGDACWIWQTLTDMNLRAKPSLNAKKVATIPKGSLVVSDCDVYGGGNWYRVDFNGKVGYISNKAKYIVYAGEI